jgi:hypothetical protein
VASFEPKLEAIRDAAIRFRHGMEACKTTRRYIAFEHFPHGSCGEASLLLGRYFEEQGLGTFDYIWGQRGDRSHGWLQLGVLIVDITADQFPDAPGPVIVGTDDTWHRRFESQNRHPYRVIASQTDYALWELYGEILSVI